MSAFPLRVTAIVPGLCASRPRQSNEREHLALPPDERSIYSDSIVGARAERGERRPRPRVSS